MILDILNVVRVEWAAFAKCLFTMQITDILDNWTVDTTLRVINCRVFSVLISFDLWHSILTHSSSNHTHLIYSLQWHKFAIIDNWCECMIHFECDIFVQTLTIGLMYEYLHTTWQNWRFTIKYKIFLKASCLRRALTNCFAVYTNACTNSQWCARYKLTKESRFGSCGFLVSISYSLSHVVLPQDQTISGHTVRSRGATGDIWCGGMHIKMWKYNAKLKWNWAESQLESRSCWMKFSDAYH